MPRKDKKYEIVVRLAALLVAINALVIIISTLIDEKIIYHGFRPSNISISINLLAGLFLLYFSRLLSRRKRVAWIVVIGIYLIFLLLSTVNSNQSVQEPIEPSWSSSYLLS